MVPTVILSAFKFITVIKLASIMPAVSLLALTELIIALEIAPSFITPFVSHALSTLANVIDA